MMKMKIHPFEWIPTTIDISEAPNKYGLNIDHGDDDYLL